MNSEKQIKPLRSQEDYKLALEELYRLMDSPTGSKSYDRAELLSILIEKYEEENFQIEEPDPIEAIKYLMEEQNINQTELGKIIGGKSKASLILNRKRALSITMIRNLHKRMKIPLEILMREYPLAISLVTFLVAIFFDQFYKTIVC
jgi:HTH-type transcriptional regulator/antitoxin HigA